MSSIAFDCTQRHAVFGEQCYMREIDEFDCTQRHAVFGEQCYMREIDEFDCLQLHSKTCSI